MSTIDTQNGKRIRDPMRIRGTLLGAKSTALTMAVTGAKLSDGDTLGKDHLAWSMMPLADFSGGGIPWTGAGSCTGPRSSRRRPGSTASGATPGGLHDEDHRGGGRGRTDGPAGRRQRLRHPGGGRGDCGV